MRLALLTTEVWAAEDKGPEGRRVALTVPVGSCSGCAGTLKTFEKHDLKLIAFEDVGGDDLRFHGGRAR